MVNPTVTAPPDPHSGGRQTVPHKSNPSFGSNEANGETGKTKPNDDQSKILTDSDHTPSAPT